MACVTLKRSLDFDPLHPVGSPRPNKRRRCIPMCVSPQSAAAAASICQTQPQSHFFGCTPTITPQQMAQNVREEIRRLKRRKMFQFGERCMDYDGIFDTPNSPSASSSGSSSPTAGLISGNCNTLSSSLHPPSPSNKDKPLFTFKQVSLICEQLVKEHEGKLREEYDKVLSTKLAEQYDCFVRFTADQIQQRMSQGALPSYLS